MQLTMFFSRVYIKPMAKNNNSGLWWSIFGLGLLIVLSGYGLFVAFRMSDISKITVHGWVAMGLAVLFTAILAGGLIWLAFYSNSHGYDDD